MDIGDSVQVDFESFLGEDAVERAVPVVVDMGLEKAVEA